MTLKENNNTPSIHSSSPPNDTPRASNESLNDTMDDDKDIAPLVDEFSDISASATDETSKKVSGYTPVRNINNTKQPIRQESTQFELADIVELEIEQALSKSKENSPLSKNKNSIISSKPSFSSVQSYTSNNSSANGSTSVSRVTKSRSSSTFVATTAKLANDAKNDRISRKLQNGNNNKKDTATLEYEKSVYLQTSSSLDENVAYVDKLLWRVGISVILCWIALLIMSYYVVPAEMIQYYEGKERNAALVELSILSTAVIMKHFPLLWDYNFMDWSQGSDSNYAGKKKKRMMVGKDKLSGVLVGGLIVQIIAVMTAVIMVCFPCPVMIDPILGSRVHFIRWCEWTPLAGYMTLMTECIDAPIYEKGRLTHPWKKKMLVSIMESLSTACGFIFPFCTNLNVWSFAMIISCITYSAIIFSYYEKKHLFKSCVWSGGGSVDEVELYERARMSLSLHGVCCVVWTLITANYFVTSAGHLLFDQCWAGPGSHNQLSIMMWISDILHDTSVTMVGECFMDLLAKCLYMALIIEVHHRAFDEAKRANRRLAELRNTMSVVWENSSDTIAISVQKVSGGLSTMISPSFFRSALQQKEDIDDISAILLEHTNLALDVKRDSITDISQVKENELPDVGIKIVRKDDFARVDLHAAASNEAFESIGRDDDDAMTSLVVLFTDMLARAWQSKSEEVLFEHDTTNEDGNATRTKYEVKVTRLEENAVVVVVRNVSERYKRFEAEKRFVFETTARQKDAEANRFTRHEVKNGLLAAIEICGTFREQSGNDVPMFEEDLAGQMENMAELDRTLHEVLDIVLAETMARDVIHDTYVPRMERLDLNYMLGQTSGFRASEGQFSLSCSPSPLPELFLDKGLFKCIHGNAVRNALKYGEHGGKIITEATYDPAKGEFELRVINSPGPGHDKLVAMGSRATELVFSQGKRLHKDSDLGKRSHSAGDGAWIMQKCARIMKGGCEIIFEESKTIFVFRVPVQVHNPSLTREVDTFHLPLGVWGIAIDDSKIQESPRLYCFVRKLLRRFFQHAGVRESHQVILGQKSEEIATFADFVVDFVTRHPGDKFFLIADENLEMDGIVSSHETISGSECIKEIRSRLDSEQESRILALVRSANDSPQDLALYCSRAHGYLPKVPLRGLSVRETVAPLWYDRFPVATGEEASEAKALTDPLSNSRSIENLRDLTLISPAEILASLEQIDSLCVRKNDDSPNERWPVLRDKLHQLDGDLKSVNFDNKFVNTIKLLESCLEEKNYPAGFMTTWLQIRADVASFISQILS